MKQHDEEVGTKEDLALHRIRTAKDKMNVTEKAIQ